MFGLFSEKGRHIWDAKRLRRSGDYQRSGELFELAERHEEALEMYQKARNHQAAAKLCEKLGRPREAASYYEGGGYYDMAAAIFSKLGDPTRSAQTFMKGGMYFKAGLLFQQTKSYREAATCFEKAGQEAKAAECYALAGAFNQAAKIYRTVVDKIAQTIDSEPTLEQRTTLLMAADCLEKGKEYASAAQAYRMLGEYAKAASLFVRLQRPKEAAEMFFLAQEFDKALTLIQNHGLTAFDSQQLAAALNRSGRHKEAGELYEQAEMYTSAADEYLEAGNYEKAGQLYEKLEDFVSAAGAYQAGGIYSHAADAYARAQRWQQAADIYLKFGDKRRAAECLSMLKEHLEAGRLWIEMGRDDEALTELQKVPNDSENMLDAADLIGGIFMRKGLLSMAVERYRSALQGRPLNDRTISLYFNLAVALEKAGKDNNALALYQRLAAIDFNYRGAGQKVSQLRAKITSTPPPSHTVTMIQDEGKIKSALLRQNLESHEIFADRYEILEKVAEGGMGEVYKARDTELDEIIALKLLRRPDPTTIERLKRELKLTRKLVHANIVRLYHFSEINNIYYLIMEFVEGKTLKTHILERGAFSMVEAVPILMQIAEALEVAHAAGVVHRDIKPQNILLDDRHTVKVLDFGIARALNDSSLTMDGEVIGTPEYMAPEQINAQPIDGRTDLYALGVVAYELVTGQVPFHGDTPVAIVLQHLQQRPTRPTLLHPLIPMELEDMILKLLQKDPAQRYASARELINDLRELEG